MENLSQDLDQGLDLGNNQDHLHKKDEFYCVQNQNQNLDLYQVREKARIQDRDQDRDLKNQDLEKNQDLYRVHVKVPYLLCIQERIPAQDLDPAHDPVNLNRDPVLFQEFRDQDLVQDPESQYQDQDRALVQDLVRNLARDHVQVHVQDQDQDQDRDQNQDRDQDPGQNRSHVHDPDRDQDLYQAPDLGIHRVLNPDLDQDPDPDLEDPEVLAKIRTE